MGNILFIHYKNILAETLCVRDRSEHWRGSNEQQQKKEKKFLPTPYA